MIAPLFFPLTPHERRPIAQLAERRSPKPKVGGSIPSWPAKKLTDDGMPAGYCVNRWMADRVKLVVAALLVLAGIGGFYQLSTSATVLRLVSVLVGVLAGAAVAFTTAPGQQVFVFSRGGVTETK